MSYKVQPISKPVLFGESPLWDNRRQQLIFADCFSKSVSIFDPTNGEILSKEVKLSGGEELPWIGLAMPYASSTNKFLISLCTRKLVEFDWDLGSVTQILYECDKNDASLIYEDGKCDKNGRYWTGTAKIVDMGALKVGEDQGTIFSVEKEDGKKNLGYKLAAENYNVPNGLGWNKDYTKLFWNDLTKRVTNVFDFDAQSGELSNRKVLLDYKNHAQLDGSFPDGLCTDVNGNVWIANWKGGSVIKVDGETGALMDKIDIPATNVTSLCFGGRNHDSMYVTTTSINLDMSPVQGEPDAGKLILVQHPQDNCFKGMQESFFNF